MSSRRKLSATGIALDADYKSVLTYASIQGYTLPSGLNNKQNSDIITGLKDLGLWNTVDAMYRFKYGDLSNEEFSLINLKTVTEDLTKIGTPTYNLNGWSSSAVTNRFNPTWKFNTLSNFTQNDGWYLLKKAYENAYVFGVNLTAESIHSTFRVMRWHIAETMPIADGTQMAASDGILGSATVEYFHNGVSQGTALNDHTTITAQQPLILTANGGTTFSTIPLEFLIIGGSGTTAKNNALAIHNLINVI